MYMCMTFFGNTSGVTKGDTKLAYSRDSSKKKHLVENIFGLHACKFT